MKNLKLCTFSKIRYFALVAVCSMFIYIPAAAETVFSETFGSTTSNTAISSYTGYSATASMFTSGAAKDNYSGSGSVGRNNLAAENLSSGYTGASGNSSIYHQGEAKTQATIIQISNINIADFSNLHLSFGALGASTSHQVIVTYKIDDGSETTLLSGTTLTNKNWKCVEADISGSGTSLTLYFKHKPTNKWTIRLDDITITGDATPSTIPLGSINGSVEVRLEKCNKLREKQTCTETKFCASSE